MAIVHWNADRCRQAYKLALLGHTDEEMADCMGISLETLCNWKREKAMFRKAIKKGKDAADAEVAHTLYQRAMGFWTTETKITETDKGVFTTTTRKFIPGDVQAEIKWLTSRQRGKWTDAPQPVTQNNFNILSMHLTNGLNKEELAIVRKMQGLQQIEGHAGNN